MENERKVVIENLAKALEVENKQISYSGIKDKVAITSQRIAIRNINKEKLDNLEVPGLFLKNLSWAFVKEPMYPTPLPLMSKDFVREFKG